MAAAEEPAPLRKAFDAAAVKAKLYGRHPATWGNLLAPGQWTCIEEFMGIDLLAWSAWSSNGPSYGRVGYEVKVSRSDYRQELLHPGKRMAAVAFCHEFYFAVPKGLLKPAELEYKPPPVLADTDAYVRVRCPGYYGSKCHRTGELGSRGYQVAFGVVKTPYAGRSSPGYDKAPTRWYLDFRGDRRTRYTKDRSYTVRCPTCGGKGYLQPSIAERIAPTLWVPADVGLVEVWAGGTRVIKRAPRNHSPAELRGPGHLAQLVRWVSARPDPRHAKLPRGARPADG